MRPALATAILVVGACTGEGSSPPVGMLLPLGIDASVADVESGDDAGAQEDAGSDPRRALSETGL